MAGDSYTWTAGRAGGLWRVAANWRDDTTGTSPSPTSPGSMDDATIDGAPPVQFEIVEGPGASAALTLLDDTALEGGLFSTGTLTLGANLTGATDVLAGATLSVSGSASDQAHVEINGAGAAFVVAGALTQADAVGSGGDLFVVNGGSLQAGSWTIAGDVFIDPTAKAVVGSVAGGAAGEISVEQGATLTLNGSGTVQGAVADAGTVTAAAGASAFGTQTIGGPLSGAGLLQVDGEAYLTVDGATTGLAAITIADASSAFSAGHLSLAAVSGAGPITVGAYDALT